MARPPRDFTSGCEEDPTDRLPGPSYRHVDATGREVVWHFANVGRADLQTALSTYLRPLLTDHCAGLRLPTVKQYDHAWRALARKLDAREAPLQEAFASIRAEDISALDVRGHYSSLRCLVASLRIVNAEHPGLLPADVAHRLNYVSVYGPNQNKPREPLSPHLAERLRADADRAVAHAAKRIALGRAEQVRLQNLEHPDLRQRVALALMDGIRGGDWRLSPRIAIRETSESVVLGLYDAVAFCVAIGLRAEIPVECLKDLRRDCLRNEARGFVDIVYLKGRGGKRAKWKKERVRDGGLSTPGGLVRLALELTQRVADRLAEEGHPDAAFLWVGWVEKRYPTWRRLSLCSTAFSRGVRSFSSEEVGSGKLDFTASRMRKTAKARNYRGVGGDIRRFATDNQPGTAVRHYGRVADLKEEHSQAIQNAQTILLDTASPLVLNEAEEQGIRDGSRPHADPAITPELLNGDADTLLGICRDFWSSPFDRRSDGRCGASQNLCLHCPNSLFTERRLAPLLSYRAWLVEKRNSMSEVEWARSFEADLFRIDHQVLSQFTAESLAKARTHSEDLNVSLALPLHVRRA